MTLIMTSALKKKTPHSSHLLMPHRYSTSGITFVIRCKTNVAFQFNIEAVSVAYNDLRIEGEDYEVGRAQLLKGVAEEPTR